MVTGEKAFPAVEIKKDNPSAPDLDLMPNASPMQRSRRQSVRARTRVASPLCHGDRLRTTMSGFPTTESKGNSKGPVFPTI